MNASRPRLSFSGAVKDGPATKFGIDWNFGDAVMVSYRGHDYEAIINALSITVYGNGDEEVRGGFELI